MQKRKIVINAVMSVLQIFVNMAVLFFLYRFLINIIGVEKLGIWSIVLGTVSISRLGDLGFSGSVVKFVAKYVAHDEKILVSGIVQTAVISIGLFIGILLVIMYFIAQWGLAFIIPQNGLEIAISILPYAFFSFWISTIAGVFQSGLDGYQRIDIRAMISTGSTVLNLVICLILAPRYGLLGLAYSQVIQSLVVAFFSWLFLRRYLPILPLFLYHWNRKLFREMLGYGVNFQIISIAGMLCDPITKGLLSKFGGLAQVGYYEMGSRMITQFRAIIISANQTLVPAIATLQETNKAYIRNVYLASYRLLFFILLPSFALIISLIPVISLILIGHYESLFVVFSVILAIAFLLNTLNVPSYTANLGIGKLRWNTISIVSIGILNAGLGVILGYFFSGLGVVIAWSIAIAVGGLIVIIPYHLEHGIPFNKLFPQEGIIGLLLNAIGIFISTLFYHNFKNSMNPIILGCVILLFFSIILTIQFYFYSDRKRIIGFVRRELINKINNNTI